METSALSTTSSSVANESSTASAIGFDGNSDRCRFGIAVAVGDVIGKGIGAIKIGVGRIAKSPIILYDDRSVGGIGIQ